MATALTRESAEWMSDVVDFAREHLPPEKKLHLLKSFPMDIWKSMGDSGLLGISIAKTYGGMEQNAVNLSLSALALARESGSLGMCLSFLIHQMVARYIVQNMGSDDQKKRYLPDLAKGLITASLAVSEPETFAHPKHIKTRAEKIKGGYLISGEKSYLTNGPIADFFVVIAVTETLSEKKRFSAFIVPRSCKGLVVSPPLAIPFFRPAPHGGIRMDRCEVAEDALIGNEGTAFEDMVLRFRDVEDALMMGAVTGAFEKLSLLLTAMLRKKFPLPDGNLSMDLGKLKVMLDTARIIALESAAMLDSGQGHKEKTSLYLFFRDLAKDILVHMDLVVKNTGIEAVPLFQTIRDDLTASSRLGGHVAELKQIKIGKLFFNNPDRD